MSDEPIAQPAVGRTAGASGPRTGVPSSWSAESHGGAAAQASDAPHGGAEPAGGAAPNGGAEPWCGIRPLRFREPRLVGDCIEFEATAQQGGRYRFRVPLAALDEALAARCDGGWFERFQRNRDQLHAIASLVVAAGAQGDPIVLRSPLFL